MERGGLEKWKGWILRLARAQRKQLAGDVDTGRGQPRGGKRAAFPTQEKLQGLAFWAGCPFSSIGFSSPLSKADQYVPFFPTGSHKAES